MTLNNYLRNVLLASILAFLPLVALPQKNTSAPKFKDVLLDGQVVDSTILNRFDKETEVTIYISKYPFSAVNYRNTEYQKYTAKVKYHENFHFRIEAPANLFYMSIYYSPGIAGDVHWSTYDNIYLLSEGDSIKTILSKDNFEFHGKGGSKLNCQSEIYKQKYDYSQSFVSALNTKNYKPFFENINRKIDSCLSLQLAILDKYKPYLSNEIYSILLANSYGLQYYTLLLGLRQTIPQGHTPLYNMVVNTQSYREISFNRFSKMDPKLLDKSPIYADFIFEKLRMDNFLEKDGVVQLPISINKTFASIRENFNGIIRDKLLALYFINYSSIPTSLSHLNEALTLCSTPIYKDILINVKNTKSKEMPFFPFQLSDSNDTIVKLSDFSDKIIILDFWYTGCVNCVYLNRAMQPIKRKFRNNPKVIFMSVSIDRDKEKWTKSLKSELYSNKDDVNLYTGGLASEHPLLKYYSVLSYPTTFIIKDGKMFNSNPPYPNGKSLNEGGAKEYVDLINKALNDK